MIGTEIVIGVIIGVLCELFSDTEGTPSQCRSDLNPSTVENPFRTIEIATAAGMTK
jgi:hypothetical protein